MIKVTLKDGSIKEFEGKVSVLDIAKSISEGLARAVVAASVNGETVGLDYEVCEDCELNLYKFDDEEGKDVFRHTSAHMLAQALKRLYPGVKLAIGPSIENGFYYDIDLDHRITEEELAKIEDEMKKIAKEDLKIERYELSKEDGKTIEQILQDTINILYKNTYLKENEIEEFKKLILSLGKSEVESQERLIDLTVENLKKLTIESKEDIKNKGNLYKKLITFSGICIGIILI